MSPQSDANSTLSGILAAYLQAIDAGQNPNRDDLLAAHPDRADDLRAFFADHDRMNQAAAPLREDAEGSKAVSTNTGSESAPFPQPFGDYELLEEIGRGGMGIVYKARQIRLNRIVALKRIRAGQLASQEDIARFQREAKAAAGLDHPHIVPIYEVGEHQGQHYFTMKLIEGGNLNAHLSRYANDAKAIVQVMNQIAAAVHHAHQRGILHRDLKPGNILIDAEGNPHVSDFGLAQPIEREAKLTQSGAIVGTPEYMAPEQARGEKGLTTAADVYGLGAIFYVLLTGQPPFQGDYNWETLKKVVEEEPVSPRSINKKANRDLEAVCLHCLEKHANSRYRSAEALADDLQCWLDGIAISVRSPGRFGRIVKWARRRPALAAFIATAVLLILTFAIGGPLVAIREGQLRKAADDVVTVANLARAEAEENEKRATALSTELIGVTKRALISEEEEKHQRAIADESSKKANAAATSLEKSQGELERQLELNRGYLLNTQLRVVAGLMKDDPQLALQQLHDCSSCPLDLRDFAWRYYHRLLHRELFRGKRQPVFSPSDGNLFLCDNGTHLEIWHRDSGRLLRSLSYQHAPEGATFSMDGTLVLALERPKESAPGDLKIWNVQKTTLDKTIPDVGNFWLSPDDSFLVVSAGDGHKDLQIVEMKTGKRGPLLKGHGGKVTLVKFAPDCSALVSTSEHGKEVKLWNMPSGKLVTDLEKGSFCTFTPDTRILICQRVMHNSVSGQNENTIELREPASGKIVTTINEAREYCLLSPDGRLLAFASRGKEKRVAL